jgi:hypothetical protein
MAKGQVCCVLLSKTFIKLPMEIIAQPLMNLRVEGLTLTISDLLLHKKKNLTRIRKIKVLLSIIKRKEGVPNQVITKCFNPKIRFYVLLKISKLVLR